MQVYARAGDKFYKLTVSQRWCEVNDNGALISCGLTVGEDLKQVQLDHLIRRGQAIEVTYDEYNHSGCQSECIKRGGKKCRW